MTLRQFFLAAGLAGAFVPALAQTVAAAPAAATDPATSTVRAPAISKDKLGYAVGVDMARNFRRNEIDVDVEQLVKGLRDAMAGEKLQMSEREVRKTMNQFQNDLRIRMVATRKEQSARALARGEKFLAENKGRPNVQVLPGGVQYLVHQAGTGQRPVDTDTVVVNYRGTSLDGLEIDATDPGAPSSFKLTQVVEGWKQALRQMPVGSKWTLWIPGPLAYGERGVGSALGPNETLVFDVELVAIK
jgi:FKBP-type peptidyl-prolyl cis-trans isomerase FklB